MHFPKQSEPFSELLSTFLRCNPQRQLTDFLCQRPVFARWWIVNFVGIVPAVPHQQLCTRIHRSDRVKVDVTVYLERVK